MEMHSSSESFTSLEDAFLYIENFANLERSPELSGHEYKLERMGLMLDYFGRPEKAFNTVHIAGSKGKGSTTAICGAILENHGFKTGMFTSPHLISYTERITLAGKPFEDNVYLREINRIKRALETENITGNMGRPTTFELLTLLAFLIFREEKCSWAVIETGLGGRLDCTNLIVPRASVITTIELEHCDILGDTYERIACEKGGIIKEGIPVFVQKQRPEAADVLKREAMKKNAPFHMAEAENTPEILETGTDGTLFGLNIPGLGYSEYRTNLTGIFQGDNIFIALFALSSVVPGFDAEKGKKGLLNVRLEGRMEIKGNAPPVVIDGSHTEASVTKLLDSVRSIFGEGGILVFGSVKGKNFRGMVDILFSHFRDIIISRPRGYKEADTGEIFSYALKRFPEKKILHIENCREALEKALELSENRIPVIVTGSFYLAGAIKEILNGKDKKNVT